MFLFESLFKNFASDVTMKFYIRAEFLTQNCLFYASEAFPSKRECKKKIFMVILKILIHGPLATLHAERTMRWKLVCFYQTALCTFNY